MGLKGPECRAEVDDPIPRVLGGDIYGPTRWSETHTGRPARGQRLSAAVILTSQGGTFRLLALGSRRMPKLLPPSTGH